MEYILVFIVGLIIGIIVFIIINRNRKGEMEAIQNELINRIKDSFGSLSLEALKKTSEEFLKLANQTLSTQTQVNTKELEEKKKLIDQNIQVVKDYLTKVENLLSEIEKKRFTELFEQIKITREENQKLSDLTLKLHDLLSNNRIRGRWGERQLKNILDMMGFKENLNYIVQTSQDNNKRPDFTILLPQSKKINIDVKFPLDNYKNYVEAQENQKEGYKKEFLNDVKLRVKEVKDRNYINNETVDFVIVFLPNDQIYYFINESDPDLIDEALKQKVILCSPTTIYTVLSIVRQAMENFNLQKTASTIIEYLNNFNKEWKSFMDLFEELGKKIDDAKQKYESLMTTRKNKLDNVLGKIENLRKQTDPTTIQKGDFKEDTVS